MARKKKAEPKPQEEAPQYRARKTREKIRRDFDDHEMTRMARSMANTMRELDRVEEDKKTVMSDFKARIEKLKAVVDADRQLISQGYEMADVDCELRMNYPEVGMKQLFGPDGEPLRDAERMEEWEKQEELRFAESEEEPAEEAPESNSDDQSSEEEDDGPPPWMGGDQAD